MKMSKSKKKRYESPAYEVEEIFEKMSLACPLGNNPVCAANVNDCTGQGGQIQTG